MNYNNFKSRSLVEEAEAWVVKLRSDNLSRADKVRFSQWLNTSADHGKAFDDAMYVWETLGTASYVIENSPHLHDANARSQTAFGISERGHNEASLWRKFFRPLPATLSAASLVLALALIVTNALPGKVVEIQRYESATGETRTFSLADGSLIELNTDTLLEVSYSSKARELKLVRGEAFFKVAKDKDRPLVVDFGSGTATAVGTAFNVHRSLTSASVTVTEGLVDVRESADIAVPNPDPTRLKRDQQIHINKRGLSAARNVNANIVLAWREQTIIFKDTPLSDALSQLNRYMSKPAYGEDISGLKISGTFSLASPEETLEAIVTAFHLEVRDAAPYNALYLRPE